MRRDRYQLVRRLAPGGTAEIHLARARGIEGFEKLIAVKRLRAEHADCPEIADRFLAEARLAAALDHPNIAQVYDVGRDGDVYYVAMEYVDGHDLDAIRERASLTGRAISIDTVAAIAIGVASALQSAHDSGVAHRDINGENVIVSRDGNVKLIDFGVAATTPADRRDDVVSLGILMWELATGLDRFGEPFPGELAAIATRALDGRYDSVAQLLIDLHNFAWSGRLNVASYGLERALVDLFGASEPEPELDAEPPMFLGAAELAPPAIDEVERREIDRADTVIYDGELDIDIEFDDDDTETAERPSKLGILALAASVLALVITATVALPGF